MKCTFVLAALISSISLCRAAPFQIRSEDDKNNIVKLPLRKRDVQGKTVRRHVSGDLEHDGYRYLVDLDIGTPPQTLTLSIDTGSSDTWVYGAGSCDDCLGGVFDPTLSTTGLHMKDLGPFEISYMDNNTISGYYVQDTVGLGSATVTDVILAVAKESTLITGPITGIMGLGLPGLQKSKVQYASFVDDLYDQGFISARSYSIFLDRFGSDEGVITFGGIDDTKYSGALTPLDIIPSEAWPRLQVAWTSLALKDGKGIRTPLTEKGFGYPVALDTGYGRSMLPADIFDYLVELWDVEVDTSPAEDNRIACDKLGEGHMMFGFGEGPAVVVGVPYSEIAIPIEGEDTCSFAFWRMAEEADPMYHMVFGDTFLRSAYTYVDLDAMTISLAAAVWS